MRRPRPALFDVTVGTAAASELALFPPVTVRAADHTAQFLRPVGFRLAGRYL